MTSGLTVFLIINSHIDETNQVQRKSNLIKVSLKQHVVECIYLDIEFFE